MRPLLDKLLALWRAEPIRVLYIAAVAGLALWSGIVDGLTWWDAAQAAFVVLLGEVGRNTVFAPDTVEAMGYSDGH